MRETNASCPRHFLCVEIVALLLCVFVVVAFVGCRDDATSALLRRADGEMESDPEKAFALLQTVKRQDLSPDNFAYYSLLYTQAQIKCGTAVSSDSLIRHAYERYCGDAGGNLKIRACFYRAKVSYNAEKPRDAMRDVLVSYECARSAGSDYWMARSAELISDIFWKLNNFAQSEVYTKETIRRYSQAGRVQNERFALCDLATIYLNTNRSPEASVILDSLYALCVSENPVDSVLLDYLHDPLVDSKIDAGTYRDGDDPARGEYAYDGEEVDYSLRHSYLSQAEGDFDRSSELLLNAGLAARTEEQRIRVMYAAYQQALAMGDYRKAALMSDTLLLMQNRIAVDILEEGVMGVQRDFYSDRAESQKQRSEFLLLVLSVVVAVALIITLLLWQISRMRIRSKKAELESAMTSLMLMKEQSDRIIVQNHDLNDRLVAESSEVSQLRLELESRSEKDAANAGLIETLFKEKWTTLNMLCNQYFEMGASELTKNAALHNIEGELQRLRTKKSLQKIEHAVDSYLGGIMTMLRNECPFLKEDDYTFLSLVFAGFSVRAVCLFTGIKYKLFYLKRSRLGKRISLSDAPHKELFLQKLGSSS